MLEIEVWRGERLLRPLDPRQPDGAVVEEEPHLSLVRRTTVPDDRRVLLGRSPDLANRSIGLGPEEIVELGADDSQVSRLALVLEPAARRSGWVLECANDRGAEVARWAYAHRTTLREGHWCGILGGHTAVLLRSRSWIHWVLLHLPPIGPASPVQDPVERRLALPESAAVQADVAAFRDPGRPRPPQEGTDPGSGQAPYAISSAQGRAFREIYQQVLTWPPPLRPEPQGHKNVPKHAGDRLRSIQTWAMRQGFLATPGPGAFSPSLPQFLVDHAVIGFNNWAVRRPSGER